MPPRATRAAAVATPAEDDLTSNNHKRKRRTSPAPAPAAADTQAAIQTPLKVVLPSPATLAQSAPRATATTIRISPAKLNGTVDNDHEPKRQRLSLKLNGDRGANASVPAGASASASPDKAGMEVDAEASEEDDEEEEEQEQADHEPKVEAKTHAGADTGLGNSKKSADGGLSKDVREALAIIVSRMAMNLPAPLNGILTLWLPPDFKQVPENTLGWILQQDSLTWEQLVDTIHIFSENLLVPCQYPNPVPPRSQFRLPIPPLPSYFPPHAIYNFCAALHSLLLEIEPNSSKNLNGGGVAAERWALMQKTPRGEEWFSSAVNSREVAKRAEKIEVEQQEGEGVGETVLSQLAASGEHFGNATAVSLQTATSSSSRPNPTLSESLIRRASLKMNRWKELRAAKKGGFGSITHGVTIPITSSVSFTPTFGPMLDSTDASGQGYYSTVQGMHERARHREWSSRVFKREKTVEEGWYGTLDARLVNELESSLKGKGKEEEGVESVLAENAEMISELQMWQELRVRRGINNLADRENAVADELLASLTRLASHLSPSDMTTTPSTLGSAHDLARRFITTASPSVRGTLDPNRRFALHDNTTVRLRTPAGQTLGGPLGGNTMSSGSPHTGLVARGGGSSGSGSSGLAGALGMAGMPPPPVPYSSGPAPAHALPRNTPSPSPAQSNSPLYRGTPSQQQPGYAQQAQGQGQNQSQNQAYPSRPGPGPSALRQSFGPGAPGTPGPGTPSMYGTPGAASAGGIGAGPFTSSALGMAGIGTRYR